MAESIEKKELARLVEAGAIADKDRLAETLTALCLAPDREPGARELDLFFDIVRGLVNDVEMQVRRKLSEGLASRGDAPHDLIVMLANDVIEVAAPVLSQSPILHDGDLIALVLQHTTQHRIAIARRETVRAEVSAAFVDAGDAPALEALLGNDGAAFAPEILSRLVDASQDAESLQGPLLSRRDLPPDLAQRMYDWVGDTLRAQISQVYPVVDDTIDDTIDAAFSAAVASVLANDRLAETGENMTAENWRDRPSPASLRRALEMQDILRFEDMFQELSGLNAAVTARALYDMGPEGLAIACRAAGLDRDTFGEVFCHLQGSRPHGAFRKSSVYIEGMAFFENTDPANARRILDGWNRPADPIGV